MNYETILYTKEEGLAIITLNRSDRGNSINEQLIKDMNGALDEIEKDNEVRAVVITGGEKFFCSGADLKEPRLPGRFRVAAEDARLGTPEVKVGIIPSGGATLRLPRLIGMARAKEFLLLGESITGAQALSMGIVNRMSPPGKALDEAKKLAKILIDKPPLSLKAIKDCVLAGQLMETDSAIESIIQTADLLRNTEDYQEGRNAFREKRKPVWKGK
jgi:enoyl-CoA hydratase/carnithine racemase